MNKELNIKVISDIHFGKKDDIKLMDELTNNFLPSINENLDLLVISGDLYDRVLKLIEIGSVLSIRFIDTINTLRQKYNFIVRIIKGTKTHDFNQLDLFNIYEDNNFRIINTVEIEEILDIKILYIPEEYIDNEEEYYKDYFIKDIADIGFFHGTMDFAGFTGHIKNVKNTKNAPTFNSLKMLEYVKGFLVGGHIHKHMNYKDKIFYTGSFSRYAFGEEESKGYMDFVYNIDTHEYSYSFIENEDAPEYMTINIDTLEGTIEEKMNKINILKENYDNIRILASKENEDISILKNLSDSNINIKIKTKVENKIDSEFEFINDGKYSMEEKIQLFIKKVNEENIPIKTISEMLVEEE